MPTNKTRWYKFEHTPRTSTRTTTHYLKLPYRLSKDDIRQELQAWLNNWFGPNWSGTYGWTKINKPPQAWLKKEIKRLQEKIEDDRITLINYYELLTGRTAHIPRNVLSARDLRRFNLDP